VNGDFFSLDYVRDRIRQSLGEADRARLDLELEELFGAVDEEDLRAAAAAAHRLRETLAGFEPATS